MIHSEPSELAGKTVKLKSTVKHPQFELGGQDFRVEDWHDRLMGKSWMDCEGNPACYIYGMRIAPNKLPMDNEVLYGKVGHFGHLIHISEIEM